MSLRNIELEQIEESHLQSLKDDKVSEGKMIEYKENLPGNSELDKKEFLADVSSFANASGGDLILGIREESGIPIEICGVGHKDADAEIRRLENIIRDGMDPRIPGISMRAVPLKAGVVIIVRIPRSWALPHMIAFQRYSRFYSRNSAGKYPLDVAELRALFVLSETTAQRIRDFRMERLAKIVADETPVQLNKAPKIDSSVKTPSLASTWEWG